ncbi:MAG: hypothetical protein EAZ07_04355 [Cytophagales bacterium]|nr:MAG: hypothetical protein EAZ07_04355 [Cytophagales bacterium]
MINGYYARLKLVILRTNKRYIMNTAEENSQLNDFRKKFWDAFHRPNLQSDEFKTIWENSETINNWLAGPLFSIYEQGNFDYVLEDDNRFANINTSKDFEAWALEITEQYRSNILSFLPEKEIHKSDQAILLFQTDTKIELIRLAVFIEQQHLKKVNNRT